MPRRMHISNRAFIFVFVMHLAEPWLRSHAWMISPSRLVIRRSFASSILTSHLLSAPKRVGIVGGGLAGLSTAYHLLHKAPGTHITIFDKTTAGLGGASSVAGGLLHPLSPQGKLVHLGLEGLKATNALVDASKEYQKGCILRNELYRVAVTRENMEILKETADRLPELSEWIPQQKLEWETPKDVLGALRLHSGCRIVHMPSYLKGLYHAIQATGSGDKEWIVLGASSGSDKEISWSERLAGFDAVVLAAGSGLFQDSIVKDKMPMQLVRGQSIEMTLNGVSLRSAMICGKYVSPLLEENRILIGATHEFKDLALNPEQVKLELRERSDAFASNLWEHGTIDRITCGFRVQSNRGVYGRMPIVGKFDSDLHHNTWIFTGLSSRGLLHHGIFGEILASKIIGVESEQLHEGLDWWQSKTNMRSS